MIFIMIMIGLAVVDLGLKKEIESQDSAVFPQKLDKGGKITLHQCHNPGFPFGFLKKYPQIIKTVPVAVISGLLGILFWMIPKKGYRLEKTALAVTIGGALSNTYDRITRHYVVDYFTIEWKFLKKIIFNLSDIFILVGSVLFVLVSVKKK